MNDEKSQFAVNPWHGVNFDPQNTDVVWVYIEITPFDTIKFEMDKETGILKIDRPQKFSNVSPALYGFIPRTYCDRQSCAYGVSRGMKAEVGDKDPLDILVLSSFPIQTKNILLRARPIGGFGLIDKGEVDDKIISVLVDDPMYEFAKTIADLPKPQIDKLQHYFLTYKNLPNQKATCEIFDIYGKETAQSVILAAHRDYLEAFSEKV